MTLLESLAKRVPASPYQITPLQVKELLVEVARLHNNLGIPTRASTLNFALVDQASPEQHLIALLKLEVMKEIAELIPFKGRSKNDKSSKFVIQDVLKKYGYFISDDVIAEIDEDDIIEVYQTDFTQVCCNVSLFAYLSYTLEDILYRPFYELYKRPEIIDSLLQKNITKLFTKSTNQLVDCSEVPIHDVHEVLSEKKCCARTQQKFIYSSFSENDMMPIVICVYKIIKHTSKSS